ncbi:MAG: c-type cytochrome [Bacteroidia bacterium]
MKKISIVIAFSALFIAACSSGNDNNSTESNSSTNSNSTENQTPSATIPESSANTEMVQVPAEINELLNKNTCLSCHDANDKVVGPPYKEIAKRNYTPKQIVELIYKPKPSNWPDYPSPMIGLPNVPKEEAMKIAEWIVSLNK